MGGRRQRTRNAQKYFSVYVTSVQRIFFFLFLLLSIISYSFCVCVVFFFFFSFCARYGLLFYITSMCCGSERPGDVEPHFSLLSSFAVSQKKIISKTKFLFFLVLFMRILSISCKFCVSRAQPFHDAPSPRCAKKKITQHISVFFLTFFLIFFNFFFPRKFTWEQRTAMSFPPSPELFSVARLTVATGFD